MHRQHSNNNDQKSTQRHQGHSEDQLHESVELDTVEELLQLDRKQIAIPGSIKERLSKSVPEKQSSNTSWWRRLLGRTGSSDLE